ncbi:MAG: type II CRISPR RNA-guided endonuclease Cas9, partial [Gammaproteobacteria bacterium]|nr:type II CRISPR RNA-guided endonuclease Cas9 [Gammaproteobacteria bacterium]
IKITGKGEMTFNLERSKDKLDGNITESILLKDNYFGAQWDTFSLEQKDQIVEKILTTESEADLITWLLQNYPSLSSSQATHIANMSLTDGHGRISKQAIYKILPFMLHMTYDKAVEKAGFEFNKPLYRVDEATGKMMGTTTLSELPYYGEALEEYVAFGTGDPKDLSEKRYGKIANPTVHIGLNQLRTVINALIKKYGHPTEVIIELTRELKQTKEERERYEKQTKENERINSQIRKDLAELLQTSEEQVKGRDLLKYKLWQELNLTDGANRKCPYSGQLISLDNLFTQEVAIEYILPYSQTLDDGFNNKTVSMVRANRIKGNRTPYEAKNDFAKEGWLWEDILDRAKKMISNINQNTPITSSTRTKKKQGAISKSDRFFENGLELFLKGDSFLAKALNDTRYLSKMVQQYVQLICPTPVRSIPGQMTARLIDQLQLNRLLSGSEEKNQNDHRHHAVDAIIVALTDQRLLQQYADLRSKDHYHPGHLEHKLELTWSVTEHAQRAIDNLVVSHKPDHNYAGAMHHSTAISLQVPAEHLPSPPPTEVHHGATTMGWHWDKNKGQTRSEGKIHNIIAMASHKGTHRHGVLSDGSPKPYKGYDPNSNYAIEIILDEKGKWKGEVITTFQAYQAVKNHFYDLSKLRDPHQSLSGKPLILRLCISDFLFLQKDQEPKQLYRVCKIGISTQITFSPIHEANVDARNRSGDLKYLFKNAGVLHQLKPQVVQISPIGKVRLVTKVLSYVRPHR